MKPKAELIGMPLKQDKPLLEGHHTERYQWKDGTGEYTGEFHLG
jgi:hypothetical protein